MRRGTPPHQRTTPERVFGAEDASLLDVVDNVLSKGVVLTGDVSLGLADVELVYLRLSVLLCAADRVLPGEDDEFAPRHHQRYLARRARRMTRPA
jgi:hypothetical protein